MIDAPDGRSGAGSTAEVRSGRVPPQRPTDRLPASRLRTPPLKPQIPGTSAGSTDQHIEEKTACRLTEKSLKRPQMGDRVAVPIRPQMLPNMKNMLIQSTFAIVSVAFAIPVSAALIAHEPFDYPIAADGVALQNGGSGFTTAWDDVANDGNILAQTLGYTDPGGRALITSGNMAQFDGSSVGTAVNFRTFDTTNTAAATTLYVSMLGQKIPSGIGTPLDSRAVNMAVFAGTSERVGIGHGTNSPAGGMPPGSNSANYMWGVFTNGNGANGQVGDTTFSHYSNINIQTAAFSVLKIELNANGVNERLTYYANPIDLSTEANNTPSSIIIDTRDIAAVMSDLNRIRPFGGNQNANGAGILNLDEIRIGTTWGDVTPFTVIPEPGSATLLALAVGSVLLRRRRR
jgi:hypothetical protein